MQPSDAPRQVSLPDGLRRLEADLAEAYETIALAAESGEIPVWADAGAKVAGALVVARQLRAATVGSTPKAEP